MTDPRQQPGETAVRSVMPAFTDRLALGTSGLSVSPFCLGIVGDEETICAAFDAGINFFFLTADMHWPLYEQTRRGLEKLLRRGVREEIVVGVVSYVTQVEFCQMPFIEAMHAVEGLDRIDLLIAGGAYIGDFFTRMEVMDRHRSGGFLGARATGASFHDRNAARLALSRELIDIGFVRFNAGHIGAREEVFPHLSAAPRTLLYGFKSTSGFVVPDRFPALGVPDDHWRPDITDHYRFALSHGALRGLLCAPTTPAEVTTLSQALARGPLDDEELRYLTDLALLASGEAELA